MIQKMNAEIATRFEEVAIILEAQQANPYRVQAYRRVDSLKRSAYEENENLFADPVRNRVPGSSRRCGTEEGR
jgi:DNA polymerase/3'-5' exonuclease PolX